MTTPPTFDLRDEAWIPVIASDGTTAELSLREVLHRAHELREIRDPLPTVEFGLYRLLTALVLDIFTPEDTLALTELLSEGQFDAERVDAYFTKWEGRFDLFHSTFPFLQTAGMDSESAKPLAGLLPPMPSGTNAAHFHHGLEVEFGVSPAVAARFLTTIAPFMTAGGAGLSPSINGAPPWYVLVSRPDSTLFETLCLNCCVMPLSLNNKTAPPAWCDNRPVTVERRSEASLLESLTWRPRRIQLVPGKEGVCALTCTRTPNLVHAMKFAPGFSSGFVSVWRDPNVPYRIGKDGPTCLRPQEGRELWRDTGPLALTRQNAQDGKTGFERPALLNQFAELINKALPKRSRITLTVYGMRTDMKMKVFEWQREVLTFPEAVVWNSGAHTTMLEAMEQAEQLAYTLKQAIKRAYPRDGKGNKSAFDTLIASSGWQFWATLRAPYDSFLLEIAPLSPGDDQAQIAACRLEWEKQARKAGWAALETVIGQLDTFADLIERQVKAKSYFAGQLNAIFETATQKQERKARQQQKDRKERSHD